MTILARLILGYLILFVVLTGVSFYSLLHVQRFNTEVSSIILYDASVLEYTNQLSDALLSESRHDRKYVVLQDEALYANYLQANKEFTDLLDLAISRESSEEDKKRLLAVRDKHQFLSSLVREEKQHIASATSYASDWFERKKRETTEQIITQLREIKENGGKEVLNKIIQLGKLGNRANDIFSVLTVLALSTSLVVSFVITRSIKKPLDVIRHKTVDISHGNLRGDLQIASPPEIADLAAALNNMCQKLQKLDDLKSDFLSHMSHELRTPLTSIKEGTAMVLEGVGGEISDKQQRLLSIVTEECNRLITLINSLLDLSKMEAGMLQYQFSPTPLPELVDKTIDSLRALGEAKQIRIVNGLRLAEPVRVDPERMYQVFQNIIGNAIKFSDAQGTIQISATREGPALEIQIKDWGKGIPQQDLESIFVKFHQVASDNGGAKGTGIGLAIVKQIISMHGGRVWATSQLGKGSTFHILLPHAFSSQA